MKTIITLATALAFYLLGCVGLHAQDKKAWIDPSEAAKLVDYRIQGEYLGEVVADGQPAKLGLQVIALGDGKFRAFSFEGGLPGAGWKRGDKTEKADGSLDDQGNVVLKLGGDKGTAVVTLTDGEPATLKDGQRTARLKKMERKSPSLGKAPPKGAFVLFDGTKKAADENWKRGNIVMKELLGHNVESKETFGDHQLHLEFRSPFMPYASGQARGNSGMYIQGRYECQILDSFGLPGRNSDCGGIYSIAEPIVNMSLPPLTWQTFDVDFTAAVYDESGKKTRNARVTIKHNGVVIHDDLELPNGTPGKNPEGPGPGILYLQGHGNPVVFRNIWAVKK